LLKLRSIVKVISVTQFMSDFLYSQKTSFTMSFKENSILDET